MSAAAKIRVLVADDHPIVCAGLSAIINTQPDMQTIAQAKNGREAVRLFTEHMPDVTLMDLRMPEMGGVEAIRKIRAQYPLSRFIVLTTYQGDEDLHQTLAAGAQGYLLKGMPPDELLEGIRTVRAGLRYVPEPVQQRLAGRTPASDLTRREVQILNLVVKSLSNKQIADKLGIEATAKWHVNLIFGRLNVSDWTQPAVAALNRGIIEL